MPRVRLNNDGTAVPASPTIGEDGQSNLVFGVGAGSTVLVYLDAIAWVAPGQALTSSVWTLPDGGTIAFQSNTNNVAQVAIAVPDDGLIPWKRGYRAQNTLTRTDTTTVRTTIWLRAEGR